MLLLAAGLLLVRRRPALGQTLAWTGTGLLLLLSSPWFSHGLARAAGDFPPISIADMRGAEAVVILASEARMAPEYGSGLTVGAETLERLRYGARIAKQAGLPVLMSGGRVGTGGSTSLAELMQQTLHDDLGLSARWLETRSRTTRENARFSAEILKAAGVSSIILVTDDVHMRRALREFAAAGLRATPAPVAIPPRHAGVEWTDVAPSPRTFRNSSLIIHELLGQLEQWLTLPPAAGATDH